MKIMMEIFSIPEDNKEQLRRAVREGYERFLFREERDRAKTLIKIHEGTCPFTGKGYMHVMIDGLEFIELKELNVFVDFVYTAHALRNDEVVRRNQYLRIEQSAPVEAESERDEEEGEEDDEGEEENELTCWICGRLDGEEIYDYESEEPYTIEVKVYEGPKVPLCSVCLDLFLSHDEWKKDEGGEE
ncbi:MAG: hypothetical protein HYZ53_07715 [Planctomycetes bacterium]|nr:hypothetical protein [Planctomycetota bacterium]